MKTQTLLITFAAFTFVSMASYLEMIPQPFTLLAFGLGFIVLIRQYKSEENKFLTLLFK